MRAAAIAERVSVSVATISCRVKGSAFPTVLVTL